MQPDWQQFLEQRGAAIGEGVVQHFGEPEKERAAAMQGTVVCDLSHYGLILASGDDAQAFLHGQLTNDIVALGEDGAQRNGYCSPKGRFLATFLIWKATQGIMLQLPRTLLAPIRKRLSMYVLRSKVKLEDVSGQWACIGVAGQGAQALVTNVLGGAPEQDMKTLHTGRGRVIRLAAARYEIVCSPEHAQAVWGGLAQQATQAGAPVWDWFDIRAGVVTVLPATQESFVPQMANYELIGGVSFKKGCYPGQEIVARTQYRGILKKRTTLAHTGIADAPQPGDKVYSEAFGDQAAGEVANVAASPEGGYDLLAVAQIESIEGGTLHLKAPDGPVLSLQALPYSIAVTQR
jgi:hypothetical protein